ncbi:MAG: IucA/IucC family siderophore biosynthesis protein, partial [Halalkalicoccus sp.]|nr:IucA/IucC family siderophore biosynthesis protein [Halalkalicoccus sp.]
MNPNDTTRRNALDAEVWETVERRLLTKMLEEFTYEEILTPRQVEAGEERATYRFDLSDAGYRFEATER